MQARLPRTSSLASQLTPIRVEAMIYFHLQRDDGLRSGGGAVEGMKQ